MNAETAGAGTVTNVADTDNTPVSNGLVDELVNCTNEAVYVLAGKTICELRRHHSLTIAEIGTTGTTINVRAGNTGHIAELSDDNLNELDIIVIADLEPCDGVIWLVDAETASRYAYRDDIVTDHMYRLLPREELLAGNYDLSQLDEQAANLPYISVLCGIARGAGKNVTADTQRVA